MHRKALKKLIEWKASLHRKPLVIRGARQVGKTWLMKEFGKTQYESVAYVNLDGNVQMKNLFNLDYDIERIIRGLEVATDIKIKKQTTLIILDEIQEVPKALSALKYFYENDPEYHIVVAGSLLGVALHEGTSFPVGKVDFMDLYPLSFIEFLEATNNYEFAGLINDKRFDKELITSFAPKIVDLLKEYFIVGGMPEVVGRYVQDKDLLSVRSLQKQILEAYEQDFSKHAPSYIVPKLREIWDSVPMQLAKENKKFIFSRVREGARAREYETALLWLEDAGIATKVTRVNKPGLPLKAYENRDFFKLFFLDIGLLGAKSDLDSKVILDGSLIFEEFKGALTEQYVFQELQNMGIHPYYFARDDSRGEIDFLVHTSNTVIPIEVKAGNNIQTRSLVAYVEKYHPKIAVRLSLAPLNIGELIKNVPLYMVSEIVGFVLELDSNRQTTIF